MPLAHMTSRCMVESTASMSRALKRSYKCARISVSLGISQSSFDIERVVVPSEFEYVALLVKRPAHPHVAGGATLVDKPKSSEVARIVTTCINIHVKTAAATPLHQEAARLPRKKFDAANPK